MLPLLIAAALSFPVPASPRIPVTTPLLGRPPAPQTALHVASNGSIALAVWNDPRNGRNDVTACRIGADGAPLDATGIVVQAGANAVDVFWTGTSFAVVSQMPEIADPARFGFSVAYVGADGVVTSGAALASDQMVYGARSDTTLLFLPRDGYSALARVVDLQGNVIRQGSSDDGVVPYDNVASNGSGFLVLRGGPATFYAETLDRDGNVLSSKDPQLPAGFVPAALTGDGHGGYALFGSVPPQNDFVVVRLDATGVATAPPQFLQATDPHAPRTQVTATMSAGGFVASWMVDTPDHHTHTYVSHDGGTPVMTFDWIGSGRGAAYDAANDLAFTSYNDAFTTTDADVFVQKGSGSPVPITHSANQQTNAAIAAGANGFLAAWSENSGTDARLYVRRFSSEAAPLDDPQVADVSPITSDAYVPFQKAFITSSGSAYLLAWDHAFGRRLDARTGSWLDAAPFQVPLLSAASNGSDVLALTAGSCQYGCTMARRISMSGDPGVSDGVKLSDYGDASQPAIASDGQNYLAVWNDGAVECMPDCVSVPTRVVAMRLRPDGSHIDAAPIVLDPSSPYQSSPFEPSPSVAWNGKMYLITWATNNGSDISGAYVGSDGVVQQLGTIARSYNLITALKTVAHAGSFVIFSRHWLPGPSYPPPDELDMTLLDGSTTVVDLRPSDAFGFLDAASDGLHLMLAYDRADPSAGRVSRVVLDPRVFPTRKRTVR